MCGLRSPMRPEPHRPSKSIPTSRVTQSYSTATITKEPPTYLTSYLSQNHPNGHESGIMECYKHCGNMDVKKYKPY